MTPKEKAIDLYTYYESLIKDFTKGVSVKELSKICAIKCVLEMIDNNDIIKEKDFLIKVGQEINKL